MSIKTDQHQHSTSESARSKRFINLKSSLELGAFLNRSNARKLLFEVYSSFNLTIEQKIVRKSTMCNIETGLKHKWFQNKRKLDYRVPLILLQAILLYRSRIKCLLNKQILNEQSTFLFTKPITNCLFSRQNPSLKTNIKILSWKKKCVSKTNDNS